MPSFYIENFGCRATDADAAALRRQLLERGWSRVTERADAELVVLNTCTVTAAADSQARDAVRKIRRTNRGARIIVTGCYAQRAPEEIAELEGVSAVVGNARQSEIGETARGLLVAGERAARETAGRDFVPLGEIGREIAFGVNKRAPILTGDIFEETAVQTGDPEPVEGDSTRPILKVQDGCDHRCSYCIIPSVRGKSRSLPPEDVIASIRRSVRAGAREIVLSGINLGSYGRELQPRVNVGDLVVQILEGTAIEQVRFSSIEPQYVTEDFISLVAESGRVAPHFHIPLQSGCDRVLRSMHRWYRTAHYAERVRRIRNMVPHAAIGADVIAGFPGETDADFEETLRFVREMPFSYLHVFSFSARPGTKAWSLAGKLAGVVIRDRARALRALAEEKAARFRAAQAGKPARALTLGRSGEGWTEALTGNYLKVRIAGSHPANQWRTVQPTSDAREALPST